MSRIALCMLACSALFAVALAGNIMSSRRSPSFKDVDKQCKDANPNYIGACGKIKIIITKNASRINVECNAKLLCAMKYPGKFEEMGKNPIFSAPGNKPLNGTKCGDEKICTGGRCMEGFVPKQKSGSYTCWLKYISPV